MLDDNTVAPHEYRALGLVNNPFPAIDDRATSPFWSRVLTHAACNRAMAGCARAEASARPVLISMTEEVPDYYPRVALNEFLAVTARDAGLSTMTINASLDMMRLGRIRGPLAEVSERVSASNLPATVGMYLADVLKNPDLTLPEAAALREGQVSEAADAFEADPSAAMRRFLGQRRSDAPPTRDEEFDALHMTYMRGSGLALDPDDDAAGTAVTEDLEEIASAAVDEAVDGATEASVEPDATPEPVDADDAMRDYLLALVQTDLSPVLARGLRGFRGYGEAMFAQEVKVTKAPRKTLAALLRLMSCRWKTVVFLWQDFDAWPQLEQKTRLDVMAGLNELRWIFGEHGLMGLLVIKGMAPELEEVFAAAEQVDWSLPGFQPLYDQDNAWDGELVQSWIDSASLEQPATIRVDGPALAPVVKAAEGDLLRFALMAEVAFRDAASRGADSLDSAAISAALGSVKIEDGA